MIRWGVRIARIPIGLALCLACAGSPDGPPASRIQSYGSEQWIVSYSSVLSAGKARGAAIRDANAFCVEHGAPMQPLDEQTVVGEITTFSLVFTCSSEPPAAAQTTPLGPDLRPAVVPKQRPERPCLPSGCHPR